MDRNKSRGCRITIDKRSIILEIPLACITIKLRKDQVSQLLTYSKHEIVEAVFPGDSIKKKQIRLEGALGEVLAFRPANPHDFETVVNSLNRLSFIADGAVELQGITIPVAFKR